jgi:alkylation response protein AidB-like acyl-CoA dehydrogenase
MFFMDLRGVLDQRGVPVQDSTGVELTAAWDGHGMTATQSHALSFMDVPATRRAWPSHARPKTVVNRAMGGGFVAPIVGVVEVAVDTARQQMQRKRGGLGAYEQVEWARVEMEAWLVQQAYAGLLKASREGGRAGRQSIYAKPAIAELAESILNRISRIGGGSAYSRHSPFGFWLEDVRALGFLRPPWGLAFDRMIAASLPAPS